MEAILLVGGLGTRLRPLTANTPKPLLPVAGRPFVMHQLVRARNAGVRHVVMATSYRADIFEPTLGDGRDLGIEITYVVEDRPLGTGGAIRNAAAALTSGPDEPVLVFNGDILDGHDLVAQVATHYERDADATLYLTEVDDARAYGSVLTEADGRVTAFLEKTPEPITNRVNAGCYVFRRSVIDSIPTGRPVSVEREVFPALLTSGRVFAQVDRSYWIDLGTPAAYVKASADLVRGLVTPSARPGAAGERLVLDGAHVAPDAQVFGGSSILEWSIIGGQSVVEGSVVMQEAQVGEGTTIRRSVVGRGARIAAGVTLEDCIVGDGAVVEADNELRHGLRLAVGATLPPGAVRFS